MKVKRHVKSVHAFIMSDVLPPKRARELQQEYQGALHDLEEEFLEGMSREDAAAWFVLDQMSLDEGKLLRKFHEGR